jgi:hypothetical protein
VNKQILETLPQVFVGKKTNVSQIGHKILQGFTGDKERTTPQERRL